MSTSPHRLLLRHRSPAHLGADRDAISWITCVFHRRSNHASPSMLWSHISSRAERVLVENECRRRVPYWPDAPTRLGGEVSADSQELSQSGATAPDGTKRNVNASGLSLDPRRQTRPPWNATRLACRPREGAHRSDATSPSPPSGRRRAVHWRTKGCARDGVLAGAARRRDALQLKTHGASNTHRSPRARGPRSRD